MANSKWDTTEPELKRMERESHPVPNGNDVIPVSVLTRAISTILDQTFNLVWVAGEISNFTQAASGHWYFLLKDTAAQIRCVMFRSRVKSQTFMPREGDRIEVRARATLYEPRGELQLNAEQIRRTGQGQLYEAFLRLKQQLESEGLFDTAKKRPLPVHPRVIGIVTSLYAAALRDVLTTLARRAPHVQIIIYPAPVQGTGAAVKLAAMIESAQRQAQVEVLMICRGGGSIEDLWAFNDEALARTIAASTLPTISGIGHETDFTIADFVVDVRAPTPTGAAELVSAPRTVLLHHLEQHYIQLTTAFRRLIEHRMQYLDGLMHRLISPTQRCRQQRSHLQYLMTRLAAAAAQITRLARAHFMLIHLRWQRGRPDLTRAQSMLRFYVDRLRIALAKKHTQQRARLSELAARIALLNPQHTLERGYAVVIDPKSGYALRAPTALIAGRRVIVQLAQGSANIGIADVQLRLGLEISAQ